MPISPLEDILENKIKIQMEFSEILNAQKLSGCLFPRGLSRQAAYELCNAKIDEINGEERDSLYLISDVLLHSLEAVFWKRE